jgi:hypothetical protein
MHAGTCVQALANGSHSSPWHQQQGTNKHLTTAAHSLFRLTSTSVLDAASFARFVAELRAGSSRVAINGVVLVGT